MVRFIKGLQIWIKNNRGKTTVIALIAFLSWAGLISGEVNNQSITGKQDAFISGDQTDEPLIGSLDSGSWYVIDRFDGYQTKLDPTKVSAGANPQGQNTTVNQRDRVSVRDIGYDLFPTDGTLSTDTTKITSLHTFRTRSGENIMLRTYSTVLEYFEEGTDEWTTLKTGYTSSQKFGFADFNVNADQHSFTYFGNGVEPFSRWNGAHTQINGALSGGEEKILVDSVAGFSATGSVIYCGTEEAYSFLMTTSTPGFILTDSSAAACADDQGIAQAVETYVSNPRGNIYLAANNRLFVSGIASTTQAVFFSGYGDATDFVGADLVTDSTADSPGIFNLVEGGGGVKGMVLDENSVYIFKEAIIYRATLTDALYTLTPLKTFDGKSQTVGAVGDKSTFTGQNLTFFITPDNQILSLGRIESIDTPQLTPISDVIKPTVDEMVFNTTTTGIVFRDKAYFSVRSSSDVATNDTVLVWNLREGFWDSPIIGFNASDFTVYNDGVSEELYFSSDSAPNVFKVTRTPLDYIFGVTANWRTPQITFGIPTIQKEIDAIYVEGYISSNTTLKVSLLLDENGYTQTYTTDILGTEEDYIYSADSYNLLGLSPFGTERFGSNPDFSGTKKFRVYLNKDFKRIPFYNAQIELASDGENQQWEVTAIGIHWRPFSQPEKRSLYRSFQ